MHEYDIPVFPHEAESYEYNPRGGVLTESQDLEPVLRLIDGKPRSVGGDLQQRSSRFAEIDGMKIQAVLHRTHAQPGADQPGPPLQLRLFIRDPQRRVMHHPRRHFSPRRSGRVQNIDPKFATDHRLYIELSTTRNGGKPAAEAQLFTSLLERARTLASRDFLTLLQDLLPEDDLSSMKNGR